jgi:hypothetical protein
VDNTTEDNATSSASTPVNDGQWHRVALVLDGAASPRRLDIYIDGNWSGADTSVGTLGVIGGDDNDPVIIGEFASLVANRSFVGDIAAVRLSDAALAPSEFLQAGRTYITDLVPAHGASFLPATTVAGFVVHSPMIGVAATNIQLLLNGADLSSQLTFSGSDHQRTVTLPAFTPNQAYLMEIALVDKAGNRISQSVKFNTFVNNLLFVEGEDYNFESGNFIDTPSLSSASGPNSYLDRLGMEGVDYHQTNTPAAALYRIGDQIGTAISTDAARQAYLEAQVTDPGVADYMARDFANTEWVNYTRTFPAGTYRVYARAAKAGTVPLVIRLDEVTSGSTTATQILTPVGEFRRSPTLSASDFDFVPLTDAVGSQTAITLSGVRTLRLTMVSGTTGLNLNYLLFVPTQDIQRPFLTTVAPAAGTGNNRADASLSATIRNGDTTVSTGIVQLQLDGVAVAPAVVATGFGAEVSYTPSLMTTGLHTATLIYADSTATQITNRWQFYVANLAVRGYWTFDEHPAGNFSSTNAGAFLDLSGNTRAGTANSTGMPYVAGSLNYANTRALRFTSDADRVVVADPSGSFTYTGAFTFEAVIRTTSSSTTAAILAKNGTGDGEGEYWWRLPGAAGGTQRLGLNSQAFVAGTNRLNDGAWHHVAAVYDQGAAEVRLYADYMLDGVMSGVTFDRPVGRPADLQIGSFIGGGSEFEGDIDFIRISDGALSPGEFVQRTVPLGPVVKLLLPAPGARSVAPQPLIQAEIQNRDLAVVLGSLRLFLDGNEVTASSIKSGDDAGAKIAYTPALALANGLHAAVMTYNDNAAPAGSWTNTWSFTVVGSVPVLALFQFDEGTPGNFADTTAGAILDASGYGRHATASAALPYVAGSATFGDTPALQFTVGGGQVVVPDATAGAFNFTPVQSLTLEAIVKTVAIGENSVGCIMAKQGANPGEWWWRINATGFQQFWINDGTGSRNVAGATALNDGAWHHLAAVYDGIAQELRLYVDYHLDGTVAAAVYTSTTNIIGNAKDLWIGAFQNLDREFDGEIDAVRISGEALDPSWFIPLGGVVVPPVTVKLTEVKVAGGAITFSFGTQSGHSYVVQATDTLGGVWGDVATASGDGSTKTVSYPASGLRRFFRVEIRSN